MIATLVRSALALAAAAALATAAHAQQKIELKLAYYVGDQHAMSKWLINWSEQLEKGSNGRIVVKRFPGAQMGPTPQHYDFARTGQADVSWFLHGGTPGRFPLTEIISLPFMVGSAEIGTKVLNDPGLRQKYLDAEHKGVKVLILFTHQPGGPHTTKKPIRTMDDFKGMRLRFASPTVRDFVQALGATPVGVPPTEIAEQLQKGTIDGVFIDYGGAGIAFKLGGTIRYSTELYAYVTSFGLAMNEDFWNKLPPDLKKLVIDTTTGREREIGQAWDGLDAPGKKALLDGGGQAIRFSPEDDAKVRRVGSQVTFAKIKELEDKGLPARAVYEQMRSLADKHSKTSKSFWN
ncbi:MAG: TRAP transporter substrate-binding protein [Burkholderiales bacterium]